MDSDSLTGGNRGLGPRALIFAFAVAMPLTFVGNQFGGFRASGWAWLLNRMVIGPLVLIGSLPVGAVRRLAIPGLPGPVHPQPGLGREPAEGYAHPAAAHVPLLAYVLAWRAADRAEQVLDRLARVCLLGLGLVTVPLVGETVLGGSPGWSCRSVRWRSARAEMFVLATINAPSWRRTMATWSTSGTS